MGNKRADSGIKEQQYMIHDLLPGDGHSGLVSQVIEGLVKPPMYIPSKFFYDEKGSELFEQITLLDEYYLSRTEKSIIAKYAGEIMNTGTYNVLVELGSGDCSKISVLLDALNTKKLNGLTYMPVDMSRKAVEESSRLLARKFPWLTIKAFILDFTSLISSLPFEEPLSVFFLGSTIGNFEPGGSIKLLQQIQQAMKYNDKLFVGFDMIKGIEILNAAYNDKKGVTACFNRNILNAVNNITGLDFKPGLFDHLAFFNRQENRIEMHLVAKKDMVVSSAKLDINIILKKGDGIHTENSYKFSTRMIEYIAHNAGLEIKKIYYDPLKWFSLVHFSKQA